MLRVYYAEVGEGLDQINCDLLSAYRKEKLSRTRTVEGRRQGIAAELLLIYALKKERPELRFPLELVSGVHGKPALAGRELFFNLSHTKSLAACAVADREVGVDVERERVYNEALVRRFFSPEEQRHLCAVGNLDASYTMLWTLKESYVKALGTGLYRPLNSFCVRLEPGPSVEDDPMTGFWHIQLSQYHFSVCVPGQPYVCPDTFEKIELL